MKIVMTLLVRDEQDIIEDNLRYHLAQGIDFFIVTDNMSEDSTPAILESFVKDGVLEWRTEKDDDYSQAAWVTRMARAAAARHRADWVINSDADEFWMPMRHPTVRDALASVPDEFGVVSARRTNLVPRELGDASPVERMTVREIASSNELGKPLPPKVCHRGRRRVRVTQGNHTVKGRALKSLPDDSLLEILHFPVRSYEQWANKIEKGGAAVMRNTRLSGPGHRWRELHELKQDGELRAFYDSITPTEEAIRTGIASGQLVVDERVLRVLNGV